MNHGTGFMCRNTTLASCFDDGEAAAAYTVRCPAPTYCTSNSNLILQEAKEVKRRLASTFNKSCLNQVHVLTVVGGDAVAEAPRAAVAAPSCAAEGPACFARAPAAHHAAAAAHTAEIARWRAHDEGVRVRWMGSTSGRGHVRITLASRLLPLVLASGPYHHRAGCPGAAHALCPQKCGV
eukprot:1162059-Pelagomonas_calceolata.AAC.16